MVIHKLTLNKDTSPHFACGIKEKPAIGSYRINWTADINCPECLNLCPPGVEPKKPIKRRGKYSLRLLEVGDSMVIDMGKDNSWRGLKHFSNLAKSLQSQETKWETRFNWEMTAAGIKITRVG